MKFFKKMLELKTKANITSIIILVLITYLIYQNVEQQKQIQNINNRLETIILNMPVKELETLSVTDIMSRVNFRNEFNNIQNYLDDIKNQLDMIEINSR